MHMETCKAWMGSTLSVSTQDWYFGFMIDCSVKISVHFSRTVRKEKWGFGIQKGKQVFSVPRKVVYEQAEVVDLDPPYKTLSGLVGRHGLEVW